MAKKAVKKKAAVKKAVKKRAAKKKSAARKKRPAGKSSSRAVVKKRPKKAAAKKRASKSLGRAKIPADAKLDHVFQKDYQAREAFQFLRVETIRELEQLSPDEIIRQLAGPVVQTVDRIRKALAINNRALKGDSEFAREFQKSLTNG